GCIDEHEYIDDKWCKGCSNVCNCCSTCYVAIWRWQGGAMVAARRIIALSVDADQRLALVEISRSRTEPANRVERARIILAYLEEPSAYAVAGAMRVSQQTVTRCLER